MSKKKEEMSFDEIVQDLYDLQDSKTRQTWLDVKYEDLIQAHFTTGMTIRNTYGLWHGSPAVNNGEHPDDCSMRIMQALWTKIHTRVNLDSKIVDSLKL